MKRNLYSTLIVFLMLGAFSANAQWQKMYQPSQYWPTSDLKSYNNQLYAAANSGVFRSADNGATWADLTQGFAASSSSSFREIAFTNAGNIYVRTTTQGIVRSMDGGITWEYDTAGIGTASNAVQSIYYDSNSDRVFIGLTWPAYGLYYKKPSDASWTKVTGSVFASNSTPVQITGKGNKLFIIDLSTSVFESSDNGNTWIKKTGTNFPGGATSDGATRFFPINNELYLGATGVWKSADDGDTWTRIDTGFALSSGLWVDTRGMYYDGSTLYASVNAKHTYSSTDKGASWVDMGITDNTLVSFERHNGTLYAAGAGSDSIYVYGGSSGVSSRHIKNEIKIFPNPFNERALLQLNNSEATTFEIYNGTGAMVKKVLISGDNSIIERNNLQAGIYFYQLKNAVSILHSGKVVIE